MPRAQPYNVMYDEVIAAHLHTIEVKYHSLIRAEIEKQLQFEPLVETRNRKPLRQPAPFAATWEIRFGPKNCFRVFYGVDEQQRVVQVLAIGVKDRNRLFVGGEEIEL